MSFYGPKDMQLLASLGVLEGITRRTIDGHGTILTTTEQTLWPENTIVTYPATASTMTVSSTSANDTVAGTGGQLIQIQGLDANYNELNEVVSTNGTTGTTTTGVFIRINKVVVVQTGSLTHNEGTIYIGTGALTAGKPANVYNLVEPVGCLSRSAFFTVPANRVLVIVSSNIAPLSKKNLTSRIYTTLPNGTVVRGSETHTDAASTFTTSYPTPPINEKIDIEVRGLLDSGTGEGDVSLGYLLVDTDVYTNTDGLDIWGGE